MRKFIYALALLFLISADLSIFGQNTVDILSGKTQTNGLPEGWITAADNYECTVKFTESKAIYFERTSKYEKCSFDFTKEMPEGEYLLKTGFEIDGSGYEIFLDGAPLKKERRLKTADGKIRVGIRTEGEGKVWGWIRKMTLTRISETEIETQKISAADLSEQIKTIAARCPCAKHQWNERGKAPVGYIKGVALTYAKSYYELKKSPNNVVKIMSREIGTADQDALAHYAIKAASDVERLRAIYTLALGLGMRESTGNTTDGRDMSVPAEKATEANAEAGLFQVSYDSFGRSAEFSALFNRYRVNAGQCRLDVFMEGVKNKKRPLVGSGKGAKFQKFTKECPAFAVEYVMIMLRINRRHFGPINAKKAEYNQQAAKMFEQIESVVDAEINR